MLSPPRLEEAGAAQLSEEAVVASFCFLWDIIISLNSVKSPRDRRRSKISPDISSE
jgi:hypothetical protein